LWLEQDRKGKESNKKGTILKGEKVKNTDCPKSSWEKRGSVG